jgi:DNA-nicking Smr family endonuclease
MRGRRLSAEEQALWARVRRVVRPLRPPEPDQTKGDRPADGRPLEAGSPRLARAGARIGRRAQPAGERAAPPLAPLEPKVRRQLARGTADVDTRLDLHGMRQADAFAALTAFLQAAQAAQLRTVLVITGKGRDEAPDSGVLRQMVPKWLALPPFRRLVVGFEQAARRHGGSGALYVRLRRAR